MLVRFAVQAIAKESCKNSVLATIQLDLVEDMARAV